VANPVNNVVYRVHKFALNAKQELCMQYIPLLDHLKLIMCKLTSRLRLSRLLIDL
jgi:hypothetical protein